MVKKLQKNLKDVSVCLSLSNPVSVRLSVNLPVSVLVSVSICQPQSACLSLSACLLCLCGLPVSACLSLSVRHSPMLSWGSCEKLGIIPDFYSLFLTSFIFLLSFSFITKSKTSRWSSFSHLIGY